MGHLPVPEDENRRRLVDRGSEPLIDYQTIGATFRDVILGIDCKGFYIEVETGTLTLRGLQPASVAYLDAAAVVDNLDGTVTIACAGHGYPDDSKIRFYQPYDVEAAAGAHVPLTQYPAEYTVLAAGDTDNLVVTATYAAKTPTTSYYAIGYRDITLAAGSGRGFPTAVKAMQPLFVGAGVAVIKLLAWR
jgi:hypothetical protein